MLKGKLSLLRQIKLDQHVEYVKRAPLPKYGRKIVCRTANRGVKMHGCQLN